MEDQKDQIKVIINGKEKEAELNLSYSKERVCSLSISVDDDYQATFHDYDFFSCFAAMREELKDVIFLCKGAKINVYPSAMARDMGLGMLAYEVTLGEQAKTEDLVRIFDYEEHDVAVSPEEQRRFHLKWIDSIRQRP
ncbi:hypothetical protein ID854_06170 [Xenorhabdus sp. M]|uniref:Uncharacterized protein n=1 Tax=Xenorhabdus szentirmaii TaxID=290112 RepID=A0AAW3YV12_9GAMM|nr:hypothetical protein [Xenorhabdus sp. M]MBD2800053.1 hypothetical protein [Xenorhabdus sp. M]